MELALQDRLVYWLCPIIDHSQSVERRFLGYIVDIVVQYEIMQEHCANQRVIL